MFLLPLYPCGEAFGRQYYYTVFVKSVKKNILKKL